MVDPVAAASSGGAPTARAGRKMRFLAPANWMTPILSVPFEFRRATKSSGWVGGFVGLGASDARTPALSADAEKVSGVLGCTICRKSGPPEASTVLHEMTVPETGELTSRPPIWSFPSEA